MIIVATRLAKCQTKITDREDKEFSDKVNGSLNSLLLIQGPNLNIGGVTVDAPLHLRRDLMICLIPKIVNQTLKKEGVGKLH